MYTPMAEELGRAAVDDRRRESARVALETAALARRQRGWAHVLTSAFHRLSVPVSRARLRRIVEGSGSGPMPFQHRVDE